MAWLVLLALMLLISAAPGISMYLESRHRPVAEAGESMSDSTPVA